VLIYSHSDREIHSIHFWGLNDKNKKNKNLFSGRYIVNDYKYVASIFW